jgi:hypothetical protein
MNLNIPDWWTYIKVQAIVEFPLRKIKIEGEIRFGKHPNKRSYETCLKIDRSEYPIDTDDKHEVVRFDDNVIVMRYPFEVEKFGGYSNHTLTYTRRFDREIAELYAGTHMVCPECNHGYVTDNRSEVRQEFLTTFAQLYELCECGSVRQRERYKPEESYVDAHRSEWIKNLFSEWDDLRDSAMSSLQTSCMREDYKFVPMLIEVANENMSNETGIIKALQLLRYTNPELLRRHEEHINTFLKAAQDNYPEDLIAKLVKGIQANIRLT